MVNPEKVKQGKQSRAQGKAFEKKVGEDMKKKGFIVSKWNNNVELQEFSGQFIADVDNKFLKDYKPLGDIQRAMRDVHMFGKLIPVKAKFNPFTKSVMMMSGGFPDYVAYLVNDQARAKDQHGSYALYEVIGVESKMTGQLEKIEKEKCRWLLQNKIFGRILIARKGEKRGSIIYEPFLLE